MQSLLQSARKFAKPIVPRALRQRVNYLVSAHYRMQRAWEKDRAIGTLIYDRTGGRIVAGPFAGLRYVDSAMGSTIGPKLLGTYEKELIGIVEEIAGRGYRQIINIGAGEGYYAVGLAKRIPQAAVLCFETMEKNQRQLRELAERNGVSERVEIRGFCTAADLAAALDASASTRLIVCDVEGEEISILRPEAAPALASTDMLVEMHDIIRRGISREIRKRFLATHDIQVIYTVHRTSADWPKGVEIDLRQRGACLSEQRGHMSWFWMKARSNGLGQETQTRPPNPSKPAP